MALKWNTLQPEHVRKACEMVAAARARPATSGIIVWYKEQALPAKEVLRCAYRFANNLSRDDDVKFASGEATLRLLESLGFRAERIGERRGRKDGADGK